MYGVYAISFIFFHLYFCMDNKEALKKLIPMSDDELEDLAQNDIKISSPSLVETPMHLSSPSKTIYGDFSMNSFVIVDTADATVKEDNPNVYMESIIDLFRTLNMKIDSLSKDRSMERMVLEKTHGLLTVNDSKGALDTLRQLRDVGLNMSYLYEGTVLQYITWISDKYQTGTGNYQGECSFIKKLLQRH
ncbi:uncharacterized protein VICG_02022 [Vittaforma corneae ATCC 50505]|uniref:Uncharacterized protein n=1 Tax=Vittaforma corneae (strain ATCC 50505) TaxID=993615 RepID=L2GJ77_VITCO|nr:uncharacterized protein VICG_02022 [Vittaforma corneae ATCC 50505]ELA40933.1 hypothetical protein VICG_02022 [Vittaforma corneae ATCC 50505]